MIGSARNNKVTPVGIPVCSRLLYFQELFEMFYNGPSLAFRFARFVRMFAGRSVLSSPGRR